MQLCLERYGDHLCLYVLWQKWARDNMTKGALQFRGEFWHNGQKPRHGGGA